jgi:hypothetical protein
MDGSRGERRRHSGGTVISGKMVTIPVASAALF